MIKYIIIFLLLVPVVCADVKINEVFPDPTGTDSGNEWIELYNNGDTDVILDNYTLRDLSTRVHYLNGTIMNKSYLVIFPYFTLNNDQDSVFMYFNDSVVDNVSYSNAVENLSYSLVDNNWSFTYPTEGYENYIDLSCDYGVIVYADGLQTDFEFKTYVYRNRGAPVNVTIERTIKSPYEITIKEYDSLVSYIISHKTLTNSPSLVTDRAYVVNASIIADCNDTNPENDATSEVIFLKGAHEEMPDEPFAHITTIYGDEHDFGDTMRIRIKVNRGKEEKRTIVLSIENTSSKTSMTTYTRYPQDLEMYIDLPEPCKKGSVSGDYTLRLEAFGEMDRKRMFINSTMNCSEIDENVKLYSKPEIIENCTENIIKNYVNLSDVEVIYESSESKTKNNALYLVCIVFMLVIAGLIKWKQK